MRIDGGVFYELSCAIDYAYLHTGAQTRVQAEGAFVSRRRCQKNGLHVFCEHANRLVIGLLPQLSTQVGLQAIDEFDAPGPSD
jgi:hypothetical protein